MERSLITNLVYFFLLTKPKTTFRELFLKWEKHAVFQDYEKPDFDTLYRIWKICKKYIKESHVK